MKRINGRTPLLRVGGNTNSASRSTRAYQTRRTQPRDIPHSRVLELGVPRPVEECLQWKCRGVEKLPTQGSTEFRLRYFRRGVTGVLTQVLQDAQRVSQTGLWRISNR